MIYYYLIYLGFLCVTMGVGGCFIFTIRKKVNLNFYEFLLSALFGGYVISITVFSIVQTGFKTVNTFFVLLLIFSFWEISKLPSKNELRKSTPTDVKSILLLLGATSFFFLIAYLSIHSPGSFLGFSYSHTDYILYAKIAKYISITGEENGFNQLNELDPYYHGPEPYHFFDLWGASLINYLFGINHYIALGAFVYPTFYLSAFLAVICLFRRHTFGRIVISFIIIWMGGLYLSAFSRISFLRDLGNIASNLFDPNVYKLSYFYVFLLCTFLLYQRKLYGLAIICALGLTIANIISAPTMICVLFLMVLLSFKMEILNKNQLITYIGYIIVFSGLIVLFYSLFKNERAGMAGAEITSPMVLLKESLSTQHIRVQLNIIIGSIISLLILYFPILLLFAYKRSFFLLKNIPFVFVLAIIAVSLSLWAILFFELNASQIFYNTSVPLMNVMAIAFIVTLIDDKKLSFINEKKVIPWACSLLLVFTIVINVSNTISAIHGRNQQKHSSEYLKKVYQSVPDNELIATLKASSEMEAMHSKYNAVYPLGNYLILFDKNVSSVNIGDLVTPIDTSSEMNHSRSMKAIRDGLYYRFSKAKENRSLSQEELLIKFLSQFNIKYIIATKDAVLPQVIVDNTISTFSDSFSGELFITIALDATP